MRDPLVMPYVRRQTATLADHLANVSASLAQARLFLDVHDADEAQDAETVDFVHRFEQAREHVAQAERYLRGARR